jgi:hypothetical protein
VYDFLDGSSSGKDIDIWGLDRGFAYDVTRYDGFTPGWGGYMGGLLILLYSGNGVLVFV